MSTGYRLKASDLSSLLSAASLWHRKQIGALTKALIRKKRDGFRFFDQSGVEISLSEVHRRSQTDTEARRSLYNLWMFYMR